MALTEPGIGGLQALAQLLDRLALQLLRVARVKPDVRALGEKAAPVFLRREP
jgi:hypothetical protein